MHISLALPRKASENTFMPVYHILLHAYGTWHPGHPDGWHQHGEGIHFRAQPMLGKYRRARQRWPSAKFSSNHQPALSDMAKDVCKRREWRCHAIAIDEIHIHIVVSWYTQVPEAIEVQNTLKRLLGLQMVRLTSIRGRRWLSDGGLPKQVADMEHLHYLLNEYLPNQGGYFWREPPRN